MEKSYTLADVPALHKQFPRTFLKPYDDRLDTLKIGEHVKLVFLPVDPEIRPERMWVIITKIDGNRYWGTLDNEPSDVPNLKADDEIEFLRENIAQTMDPFDCDVKKIAIITLKALEKRQINCACWRKPNKEFDSGWRLLYGNESDDYLQIPNNMTIIPLGEVLTFEPRLEEVFAGNSGVFHWNEEQMQYIRVE